MRPGERAPVLFRRDVDLLIHRLGELDLSRAERVQLKVSSEKTGEVMMREPGGPVRRRRRRAVDRLPASLQRAAARRGLRGLRDRGGCREDLDDLLRTAPLRAGAVATAAPRSRTTADARRGRRSATSGSARRRRCVRSGSPAGPGRCRVSRPPRRRGFPPAGRPAAGVRRSANPGSGGGRRVGLPLRRLTKACCSEVSSRAASSSVSAATTFTPSMRRGRTSRSDGRNDRR